jgi:hypothetical protein
VEKTDYTWIGLRKALRNEESDRIQEIFLLEFLHFKDRSERLALK